MSIFTVLWIIWAIFFAVVETVALIFGKKIGEPATLTQNVIALITGTAWWHRLARFLVTGLLVWLPYHFGLW